MLALFHARAGRSPAISAEGSPEALAEGWEANFDQTRDFVGVLLDGAVESEIRNLARRWTVVHETLLQERVVGGFVCDGHGDLQAEDVFCLDDGVRILDCVEFDDRLRFGDVIADVAFLAMDLERLGRADGARYLLGRYREASGDPMPESLVHYYCASRAYVRAKVGCLRASQGADDARAQAIAFQALALDHLRRACPRLVLVGGLPGSGKSTLAAGLGAARGWTVLRSDEVRRERGTTAGDGSTGPAADRYRPQATDAVYRELLRRAEEHLAAGRSVVLDASWVDASWRQQAGTVADRAAAALVELCCEATPEEADRRIGRRLAEEVDVSEATPEVRAMMGSRMDPWASAVTVDTTGVTPAAALGVALRACPQWIDADTLRPPLRGGSGPGPGTGWPRPRAPVTRARWGGPIRGHRPRPTAPSRARGSAAPLDEQSGLGGLAPAEDLGAAVFGDDDRVLEGGDRRLDDRHDGRRVALLVPGPEGDDRMPALGECRAPTTKSGWPPEAPSR